MAIRVVLAEDSFIAREGIVRALEGHRRGRSGGDMRRCRRLRAAIEETAPGPRPDRHPDAADEHGQGYAVSPRSCVTHTRRSVSWSSPACRAALCDRPFRQGVGTARLPAQGAAQGSRGARPRAPRGCRGRLRRRLEDRRRAARAPAPSRGHEARPAHTPRARDPRDDRGGEVEHGGRKSLVITKRAVERHINAIFWKLDLGESEDVSRRVKAVLLYLHG